VTGPCTGAAVVIGEIEASVVVAEAGRVRRAGTVGAVSMAGVPDEDLVATWAAKGAVAAVDNFFFRLFGGGADISATFWAVIGSRELDVSEEAGVIAGEPLNRPATLATNLSM
jgi:hypothetical protein